MSSTQHWQEKFTSFLKGRGKIQQLAELTAVQNMQAISKDSLKNIEAESAEVRRSLWGGDKNKQDDTEDMSTTILGDVTHPTPIIINQSAPQKSMALPLVAGMIASGLMGGGAAGLATYVMSRQPQSQQQEFEDETVTIGLGRIDDYKE